MIKKMIVIDNKIFQSRKENFERQELEPPEAALFCLKPESTPGPRTSGAGAAQKSGGSSTLLCCYV